MIKSSVSLPLSDDHYTAIGQVTARATAMDVIMEVFIWKLIRATSPVGRAVTTNLTTDQKRKLLKTVSHCVLSDEEHEKVRDILGGVKTVNTKRNKLIHVIWVLGENGLPAAMRVVADGKISVSREEWAVEGINELVEDIKGVTGDLLELFRKVEINPADGLPWPSVSQPQDQTATRQESDD